VGEISDALRRARNDRSGTPEEHAAGRGAREPEELSQRSEPRPASLRPELDPAAAVFPESADARQLTLERTREGEWRARAVVVAARSPATEAFRQLALRVRAGLERRALRSVVITGPLHGEGKTTIACGLALALASVSRGREVALVDLDLRRPSVATSLGIPVDAGLEEFIGGERALSEVCVSVDKPAVDVFPAGRPNESAHELLVQPGFASLVRELERRYAMVICDAPPVLLVPDASLILDQVSTYIAVARSGKTRERALRSMVELLPGHQLLGTVLNEGRLAVHTRHYGYYSEDSASPAAEG
jgi:capsular exopolysaccharide synthesis family protein